MEEFLHIRRRIMAQRKRILLRILHVLLSRNLISVVDSQSHRLSDLSMSDFDKYMLELEENAKK